MTVRSTIALGILAAWVAALGCSSSGSSLEEGDALRSTTIAKDFTFATSRAVSVHLEARASAIHAVGNVGGVQVRLSDGTEVYRGPMMADSPMDLTLMVPLKDTKLQATLFVGKGQLRQADLNIVDSKAATVFE